MILSIACCTFVSKLSVRSHRTCNEGHQHAAWNVLVGDGVSRATGTPSMKASDNNLELDLLYIPYGTPSEPERSIAPMHKLSRPSTAHISSIFSTSSAVSHIMQTNMLRSAASRYSYRGTRPSVSTPKHQDVSTTTDSVAQNDNTSCSR